MRERKSEFMLDNLLKSVIGFVAVTPLAFFLIMDMFASPNNLLIGMGIGGGAAGIIFIILYILPFITKSKKVVDGLELPPTAPPKVKKEKKGLDFDISVFAYKLFGKVAARIAPYMMDIENDLRRALMRTTLEKYISKMILILILGFAIATAVSLPFLLRWMLPLTAVAASLGLGLLAGTAACLGMYLYPAYAARSRSSNVNRALNFATQYMAILAGAEVTPERIFKSMMTADVDKVVKDEIGEIVKRMDIFGEDFYTALNARVKETPSKRFGDLLKGILAVGSMGGDLRRYLHMQGKVFMRLRRMEMKKQLDGLGITAEIYISMGVVLPLIIIIMLATMSFINSGGTDALLWMYVTTFVIIPAVSMLMLLVIDTSVPREE